MSPKHTKRVQSDSKVQPPKNTKKPHSTTSTDTTNPPTDPPPKTRPTLKVKASTGKRKTKNTQKPSKEVQEAIVNVFGDPLDSDLVPLPERPTQSLPPHDISSEYTKH